jgi:hypothetical protein
MDDFAPGPAPPYRPTKHMGRGEARVDHVTDIVQWRCARGGRGRAAEAVERWLSASFSLLPLPGPPIYLLLAQPILPAAPAFKGANATAPLPRPIHALACLPQGRRGASTPRMTPLRGRQQQRTPFVPLLCKSRWPPRRHRSLPLGATAVLQCQGSCYAFACCPLCLLLLHHRLPAAVRGGSCCKHTTARLLARPHAPVTGSAGACGSALTGGSPRGGDARKQLVTRCPVGQGGEASRRLRGYSGGAACARSAQGFPAWRRKPGARPRARREVRHRRGRGGAWYARACRDWPIWGGAVSATTAQPRQEGI